ncbi:hypothetical protein ACFVFH_04815 [Streptomyces sp. NPDC057697]|uniref:hypothetical protein n=1 Tax=Streptomyces sp. NPDC057697 TaxID=3346219 RepID=UPI00368E032B
MTFDGGEHQVVALAGTAVRLRSAVGADSVVLASYLMAAPDFAVAGVEPLPETEPFGLLETLPEPARAAAVKWQRHVVEVETGLPPGAEPGTPARPGYDPVSRTVVERAQAKADELGVSLRTVMAKRSRYARQGLWGLVDQRLVRVKEATGRADARVVAAIPPGAGRPDAGVDRGAVAGDPAGGEAGGGHSRRRGGAPAEPEHLLPPHRHALGRAACLRVGGHAAAGCEPADGAVHADIRGSPGNRCRSTPPRWM